jgi:SAM-dependent methyltransferase
VFSRQRRLQKPRELLPACQPQDGGVWADMGCGDGVFAQVLLELTGASTSVVGVDRDRGELRQWLSWAESSTEWHRASAVCGDFRQPLPFRWLSGIILANSLHFLPDTAKPDVLRHLRLSLKPEGTLILVEYNAQQGNAAVPYPMSAIQLIDLALSAGFTEAHVAARTPSSFLGEMVAIAALRPLGS